MKIFFQNHGEIRLVVKLVTSAKFIRDLTVHCGVALKLMYHSEVIFKLGDVYPGIHIHFPRYSGIDG